jgi:8-oxo-dGTP pyrophosphatase MutT (NUDIX family)
MASQVDLDRKPTLPEWLASDVWLDGLLRGALDAYRAAHREAYEETGRRLGLDTGAGGPQVRSA